MEITRNKVAGFGATMVVALGLGYLCGGLTSSNSVKRFSDNPTQDNGDHGYVGTQDAARPFSGSPTITLPGVETPEELESRLQNESFRACETIFRGNEQKDGYFDALTGLQERLDSGEEGLQEHREYIVKLVSTGIDLLEPFTDEYCALLSQSPESRRDGLGDTPEVGCNPNIVQAFRMVRAQNEGVDIPINHGIINEACGIDTLNSIRTMYGWDSTTAGEAINREYYDDTTGIAYEVSALHDGNNDFDGSDFLDMKVTYPLGSESYPGGAELEISKTPGKLVVVESGPEGINTLTGGQAQAIYENELDLFVKGSNAGLSNRAE
jgi:hypothetical protein